MATIHDLNTSITSMDKENALQRILALRKSRLEQKKTRKFVKCQTSTSQKKPKDPLKAIASEELLKLLEESLTDA